MVDNLVASQEHLPNGSLQKNALQSVLASSLNKAQLNELCPMSNDKAASLRQKFGYLCNGHELIKPNRVCKRYEERTVWVAVCYILENVQLLSWCTKELKVD